MLTQVTDAEGGVWTYTYNAIGRLINAVQPPRTDSHASTTRTWNYWDGTDRLRSEVHPESGEILYRYDDAGLLEQKHWFTYGYDDNHRLELDRLRQLRRGDGLR